MKISIIVLSWNTKKLLKNCLDSILTSLTTEIIVVDNGSSDGSPQMVEKEFPTVKLIKNKTNLGFAKGNNIGVKAAGGNLMMFLNSDTIVEQGAIEKLALELTGAPSVAAVSPLLLNEDGSVQKDPCYLRFPTPMTAIFYYNSLLKKIATQFFPQLLFSTTTFSQTGEVDQLSGAAMMFKRACWEKVGGFDEDFPVYFNDVDLSFRIKKLGGRLALVPLARIIHLGRKSIEPIIKKEGREKFYFLNFNSLFLFCEKNYSKRQTWLIKMVVFIHLTLTMKFGLVRRLFFGK